MHLVGGNFSAADLTFASLAAPVLRPLEHPIGASQFHEHKVPREMIVVMQELRATPAGAYARLYKKRHSS